jgi:hypothetical protein
MRIKNKDTFFFEFLSAGKTLAGEHQQQPQPYPSPMDVESQACGGSRLTSMNRIENQDSPPIQIEALPKTRAQDTIEVLILCCILLCILKSELE